MYLRLRTRRLLLRALMWALLALGVLSVGPVACVKWIDPPTSSFILQKRLAGLLEGGWTPIQQTWVPWRRISPQVALAVVASEDQKFPSHNGFDLEQVFEARVS